MKSKIIQITTSGVEQHHHDTQTSFVTTVLCDDGSVWRQCGSDEWFEVTKKFYNK